MHNEVSYHLRRSAHLIVSLADGNDESRHRMQRAIDRLWPAFGSLFEDHQNDPKLANDGIASQPSLLRQHVMSDLKQELGTLLDLPKFDYIHKGAVRGVHSEHLGHILAEMQFLQRAYPGNTW